MFKTFTNLHYKNEHMVKNFMGAGVGGLHQDFLEIDFLVVSDREE